MRKHAASALHPNSVMPAPSDDPCCATLSHRGTPIDLPDGQIANRSENQPVRPSDEKDFAFTEMKISRMLGHPVLLTGGAKCASGTRPHGRKSQSVDQKNQSVDVTSQSIAMRHSPCRVAKLLSATFFLSTWPDASAPIPTLRGQRRWTRGLCSRALEWDRFQDMRRSRHKALAQVLIKPSAFFDPGAHRGLCKAARESLATMRWGQDRGRQRSPAGGGCQGGMNGNDH
jgi:hypothetical protein